MDKQESNLLNSIFRTTSTCDQTSDPNDHIYYDTKRIDGRMDCYNFTKLEKYYKQHPDRYGYLPVNADSAGTEFKAMPEVIKKPFGEYLARSRALSKKIKTNLTQEANTLSETIQIQKIDFTSGGAGGRLRKKLPLAVIYPPINPVMSKRLANQSKSSDSIPESELDQFFTVSKDSRLSDLPVCNADKAFQLSLLLEKLNPTASQLGTIKQIQQILKKTRVAFELLSDKPNKIIGRYTNKEDQAAKLEFGYDTVGSSDFFYCSFPSLLMIDLDIQAMMIGKDKKLPMNEQINGTVCKVLDTIDTHMHTVGILKPGEHLLFDLFSTDANNWHLFCVSHRFQKFDWVALQLMLLLRSDVSYIAWCPVRGFSVRCGPKKAYYASNGSYRARSDAFEMSIFYNEAVQRYDFYYIKPKASSIAEFDEKQRKLVIHNRRLISLWNFIYQANIHVLRHISEHLKITERAAFDLVVNLMRGKNEELIRLFKIGFDEAIKMAETKQKTLDSIPKESFIALVEDDLSLRRRNFLDAVMNEPPNELDSLWELKYTRKPELLKRATEGETSIQWILETEFLERLPNIYPNLYQSGNKGLLIDTSVLSEQFRANDKLRYDGSFANRKNFKLLTPMDIKFAIEARAKQTLAQQSKDGEDEPEQPKIEDKTLPEVLKGDSHSSNFALPVKKLAELAFQSYKQYHSKLIPLAFFVRFDEGNHINACLIDTTLRTVELFESHGQKYVVATDEKGSDYSLVDLLIAELDAVFEFHFEKYLPDVLCPIGPQSSDSFCQTWILLYFHMRFLFPEKRPQDVMDFVLNPKEYRGNVLHSFIRRYVTYFIHLIDNYEPVIRPKLANAVVNKIEDDLVIQDLL